MQKSNSFIKDSSIILVATVVTNICFLFFHIYMSRILGPSNFGILASCLSICFILSLPINTIQTVVAKYVSNFKIDNQSEKISFLFFHFMKKLLPFSILGLCIFLLGSNYISFFLQIPSRIPIIILGITVFFYIILPIGRGTLQGLQRFRLLGATLSLEGIFRLFLGLLLVFLGLGVNGAVGAICLGVIIAFVVALISLRNFFKQKKTNKITINLSEIYAYFLYVGIALLCFAIFTNVDILFVKHFFDPLEAGYYSILSIEGRAFLSIGLAISMTIFPKVSELYKQHQDSFLVLRQSLLLSLLICSVGILICIFFPRIIILIIFGEKYLSVVPLLRVFGIAITPFVLTYILINYNLAKHCVSFLYFLIPGVILYIIMLSLFHEFLWQVVLILGSAGILIFGLNMSFTLFQIKKEKVLFERTFTIQEELGK